MTLEIERTLAEIEIRTQRCDVCREPSEVLIVRRDQSEVCTSCFWHRRGLQDASLEEPTTP